VQSKEKDADFSKQSHKKRFKRQLGVLDRLKIKKTITWPGDLSPKLYSGTS
jgi:hypothetical protein